jgi:hypothetical protein
MKNKPKNNIIFVFFVLTFVSLKLTAQIDIHSQYYFNEAELNPAMTGLIENKWRIKHFRRYETHDSYTANKNTIYADMKFAFSRQSGEYGLNIKEFTGWILGVGIHDSRVNHGLETDQFRADYLSIAIHKKLKSNNYLSFGVEPGYVRFYDRKNFDMNAGIMFGSNQITCWTEDQYFKTQAGISLYNIFSGFKNQYSSYTPGSRLQVHGGYLIKEPRHVNIFVNAALWHDSKTHFSAGANVLFFPIVHYKFYDRARLGLHYRTSNHLVFSGGLRFYGGGQKTISIDMTASYDMNLGFLDANSSYRRGFEIGIVLTPLRKCWSLSKC